MTAPPPFLSRCTLFEKSHFGWWLKNIAKHLCIRVVFVVVCFVMSRFEWNRCSCADHSTLENTCTFKVSGCVLGSKGKLSGVSRFQVLDRFLTQIYVCATETCCCILIHYGAFCCDAFCVILRHSGAFSCILAHLYVFYCILVHSNAFCIFLSILSHLQHSCAFCCNAF